MVKSCDVYQALWSGSVELEMLGVVGTVVSAVMTR
jgi:hypothetical protein